MQKKDILRERSYSPLCAFFTTRITSTYNAKYVGPRAEPMLPSRMQSRHGTGELVMTEYIDREEYCEKHCRCSNEYCDKENCPIWKAPAADVAPVRHGRWETHYRSGTTVPKGVVSGCCDMWNERKTPYCPYCGATMDGGAGDTSN